MNTFAVLRATSGRGDIAWGVALALVGALVGFHHALLAGGDAQDVAKALRFVPLAGMPLLLRYEFASGPAVLFWFDAMRQGVPGVTAASLRAEAWRVGAFLLALLLPMLGIAAAFDAVGSIPLPAALGVAVAAIGVGTWTAVAPFRWMPFAVLASLGLIVLVVAGLLPTNGPVLLMAGFATFGACALAVGRRLRALLRRGEDPAVGGDYAFVFSLGRHGGSVFSAPDSAPLAVLLRERRERGGTAPVNALPADPDARVAAMLGEAGWRVATAPRRQASIWLAVMLGWPLLMTVFFALLYLVDPGKRSLADMLTLLVLMLVVLWGFLMNGSLQAASTSGLDASLREGGSLRAELHLLPGVVAGSARWRRRLRRLWLPMGLAMTGLVLAVAMLFGVAPMGLAVLGAVGVLELVRMRLSTHAAVFGATGVRGLSLAAGITTGLALVWGVPVWIAGASPTFDTFTGQLFGRPGFDVLPPLIGGLLAIAGVLLAVAAVRLRSARDSALLREVAG